MHITLAPVVWLFSVIVDVVIVAVVVNAAVPRSASGSRARIFRGGLPLH